MQPEGKTQEFLIWLNEPKRLLLVGVVGILILWAFGILDFKPNPSDSEAAKILARTSFQSASPAGTGVDESVLQELRISQDGTVLLTENIRRTFSEQGSRHGIRRLYPVGINLNHDSSLEPITLTDIKVWRDKNSEEFKLEPFELGNVDFNSLLIGSPEVVIEPGSYEYVVMAKIDGLLKFTSDREGINWQLKDDKFRGAAQFTFLLKLPPYVLPSDLKVQATIIGNDGTGKLVRSKADAQNIPLSYSNLEMPGEKNITTLIIKPPNGTTKGVGYSLAVSWPKGFIKRPLPEETPAPAVEE